MSFEPYQSFVKSKRRGRPSGTECILFIIDHIRQHFGTRSDYKQRGTNQ